MRITPETTLKEVIAELGEQKREYMINPMMDWNYESIDDSEVVRAIDLLLNGRTFAELSLQEIPRLAPAWNLLSMVEGVESLVDKARNGRVFYDLTEDAKAAFSAFSLKKKSKFVVICPGGGYSNVCSLAEGFPIARRLNQLGYAAFVLQYRTGKDARYPNPMDDLAQAVKFIISHAEDFQVKTDGYVVMGFSAGGHLAASFGTESLGYKYYNLPRPAAMILGYPVITMGEDAHEGSREMLFGKEQTDNQGLRECYSIERQITAEYPPTYIWQCEQDGVVPIENTRILARALQKHDIPYKYEVFPGDAHGWGLGTGTAAEGWLDRAERSVCR